MDIKAFIKKHEGFRKHAYLDSLRIWTTGVGFNLERAGAREALAKADVNYDMIWAAIEETKKAGGGRKPGEHTVDLLNEEQIDKLLLADIEDSIRDCARICPDIATWPEEARAVLVDLHFNMGGSRLRGFKNTLKCFNAKDWKAAADGLTKSLWFTQVGNRAQENVALLRSL